MKNILLALLTIMLGSCSSMSFPAPVPAGSRPTVTVDYGPYQVKWISGKSPVLTMPDRSLLVSPAK